MIYRKLTELRSHPKNDYYFDSTEDAAFKLLKDDIEASGKIRNPILITVDNIIISGHQRYKAYKELEKETIPCNVLDKKYTDEDLEYILIMENLTSRNASKASNKIKLGRCIEKICQYCNLTNGNNQYIQKRDGNNFLPIEIKSFKTKQELADAFGVNIKTINNYQNLAKNGIEELGTVIKSGKISDTTAMKISRLSQEEQKEVITKIEPMKKVTGTLVDSMIKSVKDQQSTNVVSNANGYNFTDSTDTQADNDEVSLSNLDTYIKYGHGDADEKIAIEDLKCYIKDPERSIADLSDTCNYYNTISCILQEYQKMFKSGKLSAKQLETLKDEIESWVEPLENIIDDINSIVDDTDNIIQAINYINTSENDDEVCGCDDNGFLYNCAGKKIGQIQNYNKTSLVYDYMEEDENEEDVFYAYDENDKNIGKIDWFI